MAYCTIADVSSEFKDTEFDANSAVTNTELTAIIDEESAVIDSYVGMRYVVPVTNTTALLVLKKLCKLMAADRVRGILGVKTPTQEYSSEEKRQYVRGAIDDLKDIAAGRVNLPGATLLSTDGGVSSFNTDTCYKNKFDVGKQQW